jgi:hypothetical protein
MDSSKRLLTIISIGSIFGLSIASTALASAQHTKPCGQASTPKTHASFLVRAHGTSCNSARRVLTSWASHGRVGGWYCRSGSKAGPWFYCTRNLNKQGQAIAEAFHSSPAPPSQPASRGSLPHSEPSAAPKTPVNIHLTLSTNTPVIGQEVTVTINNPAPGADYEYYWLACGDAAGDECTLITNDTGPTITVTPLCGVPNPYYLEAGASTPINAGVPTASGAVIASSPITSSC